VEDRIDRHLSNLINLIRTKYVSTNRELKPMDLARKSQFLTLDIITDLAFNVPFGDIDHDEDVHLYIQSTEETMQVAIMLSTIPIMNSFLNLPIIGDMIFPSSKDKTGPGRLIRFVCQLLILQHLLTVHLQRGSKRHADGYDGLLYATRR
jgi:hypothetical protein